MTPPLLLVVEDDLDVGEALCELLRGLGYAILLARDGEEALQALRRSPRPEVILLDLMMPGVNGFEFRARQRADPSLADIPVIVLSAAYGTEESAAILAPAAVVPKPADVEDLLAALRRVAGTPPAPDGAATTLS